MPALPPGPRLPVAAQTLRWVLGPTGFMEACRDRHGDTFTLRIAREGTWVFLSDPADVRAVFTGDPAALHAGEANRVLEPILGPRSVLLLDGDAHMRERRLMLPPFHGERMQRYGDLMEAIVRREVEGWPAGEPFALRPRMQAITLEVIMRAVFGVQDAERLDRLRAALRRMLDWTTARRRMLLFAALGRERMAARGPAGFRAAMESVDALVLDEIRRRRADPGAAERDDILSLLLGARHEDGEPMSDAELRDELLTLLVAGHETTATSLTWAFERLVRHPDALARLTAELAAGREEYAEAVTRETLRLRPVLPIVLRRLVEPLELPGRTLPAGIAVAPCIYLVHRRPDVYPDPQAFRPERFLEEPPGTYTWIPFGGGVRRCLGASFALFEMRVVLATVLRHARLVTTDARPERVLRRAITLTPARDGRVALERLRGAAGLA